MGAAQFQRSKNHFQHRVGLLKYPIIPEAYSAKPPSFDFTVATLIMQTTLLMLASVQFDNEFRVETSEIGDIAPDWNLPAESVAAKLPSSQVPPKMNFSIGGLGP